MQDKNDSGLAVTFFFAFVLGMGAGGILLSWATQKDIQKDAVKSGVGEYNKSTGNFQWKQFGEKYE